MPWETCAKCKGGSYYPESGGFCRYCSAAIAASTADAIQVVSHPVGNGSHPGSLEDCASPSCSPHAAPAEPFDPHTAAPPPLDLLEFFDRRAEWSAQTFGPGDRTQGVVAHIRKELLEIEAEPSDLEEWVDVVLLAMDGAWRSAGASGLRFANALQAKQAKNTTRTWPDWRAAGPDQPIEHVPTTAEQLRAAAVGERVQRVQIASGAALDAIGDALGVQRWASTTGDPGQAEGDGSYRRRLRQAAAAEFHAGVRRVAYQTGEDMAHEVLADVHAGAAAARMDQAVAAQNAESAAAAVRAKAIADARATISKVLAEIGEVADLCSSADGDSPRADLVVNLVGTIRTRIMERLA